MAEKKGKSGTTVKEQKVEKQESFTKEQILGTKRYRGRSDLLNALLEDGHSYTFDAVDKKIVDFMKGSVK